ncbi:MAG: glutamate--tRNA ligase [Oscillospiraceae bacterium]|jgi:glutamyl-tRNA synthetase|nr:glutamate--tRNA ligase [Oscillospiraceae bacterium]
MDYGALADLLFADVREQPDDIEALYPPRNLPEGAKVTRMAPSPTGFMHLGNLFSAIADERLAHQSGGVFYLRIEDTDLKRAVEGGVEKILDVFSDYKLPFDEGATLTGDNGPYGPYRQRQRTRLYHVFAKWLVAQGMAYPCFCTEEELAATREKQAALKENFGYYGQYAVHRDMPFDEIKAQLDAGTPFVLRFRSDGSLDTRVKFTDLVKGPMAFPENDQDTVLLKSDGVPTYHFAHVVDDHLMHTTHVVRGEEWLATLPIHVQLFGAMGWRPPKYIHTAQLMKMDGGSKRKLSKRKDPELALDYYKEQGYCVEAVKEYILTLLNSNFEEWRIANPTEPLEKFPFSFKKMSVSGSLFDIDKLNDISKNVISRMDAATVYDLVLTWAGQYDTAFADLISRDPAYTQAILAIGRGGNKPRKDIAVWADAKGYMNFFFDELFAPDDQYPQNLSDDQVRAIIKNYRERFVMHGDSSAWFDDVKTLAGDLGFAPTMKDYKNDPQAFPGHVGDVSMVIRIAVTGRQNSPDLYEVINLLGAARVKERLEKAQNKLQ